MASLEDGFAAYFARFPYRAHVMTYSPDLDSSLFCAAPVAVGLVCWQPKFGTSADHWVSISTVLTPAVREYFATVWFLYVGGHFRDYQLMLHPIAPRYFPHIISHTLRSASSNSGPSKKTITVGYQSVLNRSPAIAYCWPIRRMTIQLHWRMFIMGISCVLLEHRWNSSRISFR